MNRMITSLLAVVASVATASAAQPYKGEVEKVDASAGKVTLKAGPIKKLDMDAMSMGYRVSDLAMLKNVKVGDRITFDADEVDGVVTITKIEKAK